MDSRNSLYVKKFGPHDASNVQFGRFWVWCCRLTRGFGCDTDQFSFDYHRVDAGSVARKLLDESSTRS